MSAEKRVPTALELVGAADSAAAVPDAQRLGRVAAAYARLGIRVFPLHHPTPHGCSCGNGTCRDVGKHPRTAKGVKDATSDIEIIRAWWFSHPYSNIGIATGHLFDVLDVDSPSAARAVADLRAAGRVGEVVAAATTGRSEGGAHLFVAATGAGCVSPPIEGLDFRGRGGYVVAAPSLHRSGAVYAWDTGPTALGDPETGHAMGVMPWENIRASMGTSGPRETAYAREMLRRQDERVSLALPGYRIPRLLKAANNLGAVGNAGWIDQRNVTDGLLAAYERAGGTDDRAARHAIESGLRRGSGLPLPDLGSRTAQVDPRDVIDDVVAWMHSARTGASVLGRGRVPTLDVLQGILTRAEQRGRTCVPVAVRDAQAWGGYQSTSPASKALNRLVKAGVLTPVTDRSWGPGAARRFRLRVPVAPGFASNVGVQDTVGVTEASITTCTPKFQSQDVATHALWGNRRGYGYGLTRNDRALFAVIAPEPGLEVVTSVWAGQAGVTPKMVRDACADTTGSLSDLDLVARVARGTVALTTRGAQLARAVQEHDGPATIDDLARELGVATRKEVRESGIAAARLSNREYQATRMVERLMSGWLATSRVPPILSEFLGSVAAEQASRVCGGIDMAQQPRLARVAMQRLLSALENWPGSPRDAICSPQVTKMLRAWLSETDAAVREDDLEDAVRGFADAWWRTRQGLALTDSVAVGPQSDLDAQQEHQVLVARHLLARQVRTPRCVAPPTGYRAAASRCNREAA